MIKIKDIYIYRRKDESLDLFVDILKYLHAGKYVTYTDSDRHGMAYDCLKHNLEGKEGILIFSGVESLGGDEAEILKEINYFAETNLDIIFLSYPTMLETIGSPWNHRLLLFMKEILGDTHTQIIPFPERQKLHAGRKKITFPQGWEELYKQWENKEITAREFMKASHLKKGTFYHMMAEYKDMQQSFVEEHRFSRVVNRTL